MESLVDNYYMMINVFNFKPTVYNNKILIYNCEVCSKMEFRYHDNEYMLFDWITYGILCKSTNILDIITYLDKNYPYFRQKHMSKNCVYK